MRLAVTVLVMALSWQLSPGAGEVLENAIHLAVDGHFAHDDHADPHEDPGPEHECGGAVHLCRCCVSAAFVAPSPAVFTHYQFAQLTADWCTADLLAEGY